MLDIFKYKNSRHYHESLYWYAINNCAVIKKATLYSEHFFKREMFRALNKSLTYTRGFPTFLFSSKIALGRMSRFYNREWREIDEEGIDIYKLEREDFWARSFERRIGSGLDRAWS